MKILYLGDIVGTKTVDIIVNNIKIIKEETNFNILMVNGENINNGSSIDLKSYKKLMQIGVSCISMGNHTFSHEIEGFIEDSKIIRPLNYNTTIGKGYITILYNDIKITVINLLGKLFINNYTSSPFDKLNEVLQEVKSDYYIVDFHADATSEKIALAYLFKDKIDALVGTHTHVQTNDARVIDGKCLFITDLGMCGAYNSILGYDIKSSISRFTTGINSKSKVAYDKEYLIQGAVLNLKSKKIEIYKKIFKEI